MNLKSLTDAMGFLLDSISPSKAKNPIRKAMVGELVKQPQRPMASACPIGAFTLFDLPPELVVAIISESINTLGFYRAVRLRSINKFFDQTITNIIFSEQYVDFLPDEIWRPSNPDSRAAFAKILETKFDNQVTAGSPLQQAITRSISLLEGLSILPKHDSTNHHQIYAGMLCASVVNVLSMRGAIQNLSSRNSTDIENPSKGALTLASALGDVPAIGTLIARGFRADDQSQFFCSAVEAAAEYGHIDALKALSKHSQAKPEHIFRAIRGGQAEIVQLLLDKYYTKSWFTLAKPYGFEDYSEYTWKQRKYMISCAAESDQVAILDTLVRLFPRKNRPELLKDALYRAVQHYSIATISSLLDARVNISTYDVGSGTALHIASNRGDLEIVRLLIDHGFEGLYGCNGDCMHIAAAKGHIDVVQFFLDHGVDVNCGFSNPLDGDFWDEIRTAHPATMNAARRGDFHMFCFLVKRGGRVDLEGNLGPMQQDWLEKIRLWEEKSPKLY